MLKVSNIRKKINGKAIIDDISFKINSGNIYGLLGPNGAGKTTTFYSIAGLIKCDEGEIYLDDSNITKLPMHKRSKLGIKYLPQEPSIFQNLTVMENLMGLAELSYGSKKDIDQFVEKSIEDFKLSKILYSKGRELSGGQRRKVEIARTLAADPKIILLDEPFAGIDPIAIEEIQEILRIVANNNIGILITDHNVREALDICYESIVISQGKVIATGSKNDLISNELVKKVYIGKMYS
ncbi:LPS export ABC transporter ATP-binding protein [Gammaproteobacteria bacterium]|jgi:lipopolysaccharide export system ATP-binding protein|nr:LPS export ABC transporter ATP-binding protein [Gammaproteobacteria bacterium]MDC1124263.1 LPS export ABC transporter ATP-binding protein [Gammaproteobacteria bacterium]